MTMIAEDIIKITDSTCAQKFDWSPLDVQAGIYLSDATKFNKMKVSQPLIVAVAVANCHCIAL